MRSRFIGGLALIALIASAATLSTATHASAAAVAAEKEVIKVSAPAPLALAPVVVSQVEQLVPAYRLTSTRAHAGVDIVMCVVAERGSDSLTAGDAGRDSILGRLRIVIPRRYESTVAPPNARSRTPLPRSSANRADNAEASRSAVLTMLALSS